MSDINRIIVTGRTGKDAEMTTVGETALCKFSLAVAGWNKKQGETTMWIDVDLWGNRAKVGQYIRKGMKLTVCGQLKIRDVDGDGGKRRFVSINADDVVLPDRSENAGNGGGSPEAGRSRSEHNTDPQDDLPF